MTPITDRPIQLRRDQLPELIKSGTFDAYLQEIIAAVDFRVEARKAEVNAKVKDVFGPDATIQVPE